MRNKLIDELEKMIELLHQTGWHKQAVWYENKLKLIILENIGNNHLNC